MEKSTEEIDFRIKHQSRKDIKKGLRLSNLEHAPEPFVELVNKNFQEIKDFLGSLGVTLGFSMDDIKLPDVYVSDDVADPGVKGGAIIFPKKEIIANLNQNDKNIELRIKHELMHYFFDRVNKYSFEDSNNLTYRHETGALIDINKLKDGEIDKRVLFSGFNEGLTQFIATILTYKDVNIDGIFKNLDSVRNYVDDGYADETLMVYKMWQTIAKSDKAKGKYVFKLLFELMASGNPEFFHLVKAVYGKGAVKLLSKFRPQHKFSTGEMRLAIINDKIRKFFETADEKKRENLLDQLADMTKETE